MVAESFFSNNHNVQILGINNTSGGSSITITTSGMSSTATSVTSTPSTTDPTITSSSSPTISIPVVVVPTEEIIFEVGNSPPQFQLMQGSPINCNLWATVLKDVSCEVLVNDIANTEPSFSMADLLYLNPGLADGNGACDNENIFPGFSYCISTFSSVSPQIPIPRDPESRKIRYDTSLHPRESEDIPLSLVEAGAFQESSDAFDSFSLWQNAYAMSPYLAMSRNISKWNGLSNLTSDLQDLLLLTNITTSNFEWEAVEVISQDWIKMDFPTCLNSYKNRYRATTGTLIMVVGQDDNDILPENDVLGIAYVSYNFTDLAVMCPGYYMNRTSGGINVTNAENAPTLPLTFGTFGFKSMYRGGKTESLDGWETPWYDSPHGAELCPPWYPGIEEYTPSRNSIPKVRGCLSHVRGSLCRIGYNVPFFSTIIICLVLRTAAILCALFILKNGGPRIVTVGDAIAEFLENEDLYTRDCSLIWTPEGEWQRVDGPLLASSREEYSKRQRRNSVAWLWRCLRRRLDGNQDFSDAIPKLDLIRYAHTMKFLDRESWIIAYLCTLGVVAGINGSIALQSGWFALPESSA